MGDLTESVLTSIGAALGQIPEAEIKSRNYIRASYSFLDSIWTSTGGLTLSGYVPASATPLPVVESGTRTTLLTTSVGQTDKISQLVGLIPTNQDFVVSCRFSGVLSGVPLANVSTKARMCISFGAPASVDYYVDFNPLTGVVLGTNSGTIPKISVQTFYTIDQNLPSSTDVWYTVSMGIKSPNGASNATFYILPFANGLGTGTGALLAYGAQVEYSSGTSTATSVPTAIPSALILTAPVIFALEAQRPPAQLPRQAVLFKQTPMLCSSSISYIPGVHDKTNIVFTSAFTLTTSNLSPFVQPQDGESFTLTNIGSGNITFQAAGGSAIATPANGFAPAVNNSFLLPTMTSATFVYMSLSGAGFVDGWYLVGTSAGATSGGAVSGTTITATTAFRAGDGGPATPSISFTNGTGNGFYLVGSMASTSSGVIQWLQAANIFRWTSTVVAGWSSGDPSAAATDTGLSRLSAGIVAVGTGAASSIAGGMQAAFFSGNVAVTETAATHTVATTTSYLICNRAGTITVTLPSAASFPGREITIKTITANTVVSNTTNVIPQAGGAAAAAILAATAGKYATLVSNGTNWEIFQAN